MLGAALALVVLGIIVFFFFWPVGMVMGIAGIVLLVLFLLGFGKRAARGDTV
jgi:hypothetical protein